MDDPFFQRFREAMRRLPEGLIRVGPPAPAAAVAAASAALAPQGTLPEAYRSFLRSFDGADLFHGGIELAGVTAAAAGPDLLALNRRFDDAPERAATAGVAFAQSGNDVLVFDDAGCVRRRRGDEVWLAGSDFARWLDAAIAHDAVLYGPDGEFLEDAFEPDGEEVTPATALRQSERALKRDPGSAEAHHERGLALRRAGRLEDAVAALERAAALDGDNPWPAFDLGRACLAAGQAARAGVAFGRAAERLTGPEGALMLAWAARAHVEAGDAGEAARARQEALSRNPGLAVDLRRASEAAAASGEAEALAESERLEDAISPGARRLRLPLLPVSARPTVPPQATRSRPTPPPGPPRPRHGKPRPRAASRRAR